MAVQKKYSKSTSVLGRGLDDIGSGRGLDALIDTGDVRTQGSSNLIEVSIDQIAPNPNQPRREFDEEALQELVFKTVIQRNVKLSESPSHGLPVILYDADSTGSKNHLALAKEIISKNTK